MDLLASLGLGVVLFASTDIDDLFLLMGFFADPRFHRNDVIVGQYLGMLGLIAASVIVSLVSFVLDPAYVGLLGVFPVLIGLKRLIDLKRRSKDEAALLEPRSGSWLQILSVFTVTIANGGDNVGAYAPLFATQTARETVAVSAAMLAMTALWLTLAHWLANHPTIGAPIRRYSSRVVPFVLIALGLFILHRAGTVALAGL